MSLIGGLEKQLPHHPIGIVDPHRELAPDHFLFLAVLLRRAESSSSSRRPECRARCDAFLRHIDPENGAIERSIGIDVAAHVLDFLRDRVGRSRLGSLEKHVLENVRKARAEMLVFVDAAGRAPRLHARDRRAAIFLHDDREAVRQRPFLRGDRRKTDGRRSPAWRRALRSAVVNMKRKQRAQKRGSSS